MTSRNSRNQFFPKLLLVENDKTLLTMMANALHAKGFGIVGTATDANTAFEYFSKVMPDVAIVDVGLGKGPSGVDLVNAMRIKNPKLGVLFSSSFASPRVAKIPAQLMASCVFLPKDEVTKLDIFIDRIYDATRVAAEPEPSSKKNSIPDPFAFLTLSDIQLLELISQGLSNKQIAVEKGITVKSCENAIARLAKKLEVPRDEKINQRVTLSKMYLEFSGKSI
jgi:two-component system, NarL family, nitrate/nitrite response regulator NarL